MNDTDNIPSEIVEAITSAEVYEALEKIGEKHNLMLDQVGQLDVNTRLTLLGKQPAEDFIQSLAKDLEIPLHTAKEIAEDVKTEVFLPLKESIRKMQEERRKPADTFSAITIGQTPALAPIQPKAPVFAPPTSPVPPVNQSSLEKVGGFAVEKRPPSSTPLYDSSNLKREAVLKDLEDIEKLKPQNAGAFVEHLLPNTAPISRQVENHIEIKKPEVKPASVTPAFAPPPAPKPKPMSPEASQPAPQTPQKPRVDPYRESI